MSENASDQANKIFWLNPEGTAQDPLGRSLAYFLLAESEKDRHDDAKPELQLLQDDLIVIASEGVLCAIIRHPDPAQYPDFDPKAYAAGLKQLAKGLVKSRRPAAMLLLGGDSASWKDLRAAKPFVSFSSLSLYQLDQQSELHVKSAGRKQPLKGLIQELQRPSSRRELAPEQFLQLETQLLQAEQQHHQTAAEMDSFRAEYRQRKPWLTWSLAVLIAAVYGLQMLWGGSDKTPVLLRMGAMSAEGLARGEWWRLWSASFLHGSVMHVGFNLYVLVILGDFIERVLGRWRLLLLYVAAVGAGGIGSWIYLSQTSGNIGLSVGASGGLWGLLGAHAVLAFRQKHLLPSWLHAGAQKAAVINLGINVLNSFQPHVDFAAHLGGGLMGGLLMLSGLMTRGVTPLSRMHAASNDDDTVTGDGDDWKSAKQKKPSALLKLAGLLSGALLLATLVLALVHGQPWQLSQAPTYQPQKLNTAMGPVQVLIPDLLKKLSREQRQQQLEQQTDTDADDIEQASNGEQVFGDARRDPAMIVVASGLMGPGLVDPKVEAESLSQHLQELPPGVQFEQAPVISKSPTGDQQVRVRYRYANGLLLHQMFHLGSQFWWRVDVLSWPDLWDGEQILQEVSDSLASQDDPS